MYCSSQQLRLQLLQWRIRVVPETVGQLLHRKLTDQSESENCPACRKASGAISLSAFTLVELMLVVAVLGILSAMAVPNLLRARISSNDQAVKGDVRTFRTAAENFRAAQKPPRYATTMGELTGSHPSYLDGAWDAVPLRKHGHTLVYAGAAGTYGFTAQSLSGDAEAHYCVDQTGVLRISLQAILPAAGVLGCTGNGWAVLED